MKGAFAVRESRERDFGFKSRSSLSGISLKPPPRPRHALCFACMLYVAFISALLSKNDATAKWLEECDVSSRLRR